MNFCKTDSLFVHGMKVSVYSERKAEQNAIGWHRSCYNISYTQNQYKKEGSTSKTFYTLAFTYDFEFDDDQVYFAYCIPYTYSDMMNDLLKLESDPERNKFMQRKTLCQTLGGLNCEVLTVSERDNGQEPKKNK